MGRVLDSLVIDRPLPSEPVTELPPEREAPRDPEMANEPAPRPKSRSARAAATKDGRSEPPKPIAIEPSPQTRIGDGAGMSSPPSSSPASPAPKGVRPKTAPAKTEPSNGRQIVAEEVDAPKPIATNASAAPKLVASPLASPKESEVAPASRKRKILGRYVHGNELKPGERWKLRRLKKR